MNSVTRSILSAYFQADMTEASARNIIANAERQLKEAGTVKQDVINHLQGNDELREIAEVLELPARELLLAAIVHFDINDDLVQKLHQSYLQVGVNNFKTAADLVDKLTNSDHLDQHQFISIGMAISNMVDLRLAEKNPDQPAGGGFIGMGGQFQFLGDDIDQVYRQRLGVITGRMNLSLTGNNMQVFSPNYGHSFSPMMGNQPMPEDRGFNNNQF